MNFTIEQQNIIRTPIKTDHIIKITAFAGTGKTTILKEISVQHPLKKFLYICFNKSLQEEAKSKFPKNTTTSTSHALAKSLILSYKSRICHSLNISHLKVLFKNKLTLIQYENLIRSYNNFTISIDPTPNIHHLSIQKSNLKATIEMLEYLNIMWLESCRVENSTFPITHDAYLKLYVQANPKLNYDCIMFDEAQDANPLMTKLILSQDTCKIFVGDPHQQIYSFRGAINAMESIPSTHSYFLTQSFRFTNKIAHQANFILNNFKGEKKQINSLVQEKSSNESKKIAILTRGRFELFKFCIKHRNKYNLSFIGDFESYKFDFILDLYFLKHNYRNKIRNSLLLNFSNFPQLNKYLDTTNNPELKLYTRIFQAYGYQFIYKYEEILYSRNSSNPKIHIGTAHKSKGLEYDQVRITDDFLYSLKNSPTSEEFNLLYVAITRAKTHLFLSKKIKFYLLSHPQRLKNLLKKHTPHFQNLLT